MKMSRRAKRMARHHKRHGSRAAINLVSLMDIFTILVFFLLVNSSDVEQLQNQKSIVLPKASIEKKPKETLVIMVNDKDLYIKGRKIAQVQEYIKNDAEIIEPLKKELEYQASKVLRQTTSTTPFNGEVTIMGDKEIPYKLLKKIMITCARSHYGRISLAVTKKSSEKG